MLLLTALFTAPNAADPPVRVTTDGASYCDQLITRLLAEPHDARMRVHGLTEEGRRLCGTGQTRSGIAKLRRALRIVHGAGS